MRQLLSLVVIGISTLVLTGCATYTPKPGYEKELNAVKEFPKIKKDVLFKRAELWIAKTFDSQEDKVQIKDKETGKIICTCLARKPFDLGIKRPFMFTLQIDVKDGKMRVQYENLRSVKYQGVYGPNMDMQWDDLRTHVLAMNEQLFKSVESKDADTNW